MILIDNISTLPNPRSEIKWDAYLATVYAEGFNEGENATPEETIEGWAYLIGTKMYLSLQGSFGRTSVQLMEHCFITEDGTIDWDNVDNEIKHT